MGWGARMWIGVRGGVGGDVDGVGGRGEGGRLGRGVRKVVRSLRWNGVVEGSGEEEGVRQAWRIRLVGGKSAKRRSVVLVRDRMDERIKSRAGPGRESMA